MAIMESAAKTTTDPNLVQPGSWQEFIIISGEACSIAAVILSIIFLLFDSLRTSYPVNVVIIILLVLLWTFGASAIYAQLPWKYLLMLLGPATTVMLIVIFVSLRLKKMKGSVMITFTVLSLVFVVAGVACFTVETTVLPVLFLPIIFWGLASIFAIIIIVQFCRYIVNCSMSLLVFTLWFEMILTCNSLALALIRLLEKNATDTSSTSSSTHFNF